MNLQRDIHTVTEFKKNASALLKQLKKTKRPLVLTVNGKAAVVLQDVESYQKMTDDAEYHETVAALKEAVSDIDNSDNWQTHDEVFKKLRSKRKRVELEIDGAI